MTFPREGKFTSSHFFASRDVMGRAAEGVPTSRATDNHGKSKQDTFLGGLLYRVHCIGGFENSCEF